MTITVLICTHNRASTLAETLDSIFDASNAAEADWEVLVVDNASTDSTPELCRKYESQYPRRFRSLVEPKRGKSEALNTGIASAAGELIAMADDDVICARGYITNIRKTFQECRPDAAQGRTFLSCEGGWPAHLHRDLAMFMGLRDFGDKCIDLPGNLCGTNSVVRAEVFKAVGGYSTTLGAGKIGFAEDTEMSERIRKAGFRLIYAPDIVVTHQLPKERLTPSAFRTRYFGLGRSNAYREPITAPLWRFGLYVLKQALVKEPTAVWQRLRGRPAQALRVQCEVRELAGFWLQHWQMRQGSRLRSGNGS